MQLVCVDIHVEHICTHSHAHTHRDTLTHTHTHASTDPGDYTGVVRTLTFAPDESTLSIPIDIINDDIFEFDEMFNAVLSNPGPNDRVTLGVDTADITIQDNDGKHRCFGIAKMCNSQPINLLKVSSSL